ncbi:MAG: acetyl-CoA C-acyltransferase FadI [Deltaproteobacteria bacterium]|nr:acetyl-CoA C-acyltransferase FadI [Deltaproteobacteria bacterium]
MASAKQAKRVGRRVAIVNGLRTPFLKSGTEFMDVSALDLAVGVVAELVQRTDLDPNSIDLVTFGQVIPGLYATMVAREVVLRAGLPKKIPAATVARACATSAQAITDAADQIALGLGDVAIAGGTDSLSDPPLFASRNLTKALMASQKGKSLPDKLRPFSELSPKDLAPTPPAIKEPTTGLLMGESADKMAKENHIARRAQDELALQSHKNAAAAWEAGKFKDEVMSFHVAPKYATSVSKDNLVRPDATLEKMSELPPVFDRKYGTVTAANASPLTDGAAAVVLMAEEKAKALGVKPLGYLRSYAYAAVDPAGQLLQGPAYAAPVALDRAGLTLKDLDLIDMHEAFAAQVLSNIMGFESKAWAEKELGRAPLGEVDRTKLNVNGGSISIGHPFGATGARIVTQQLRELNRRGGQFGLVTICAAGGMGAALVLERE